MPSNLAGPWPRSVWHHHDISANQQIRKPDGYNYIVQNKSMCTQDSTPWSLVLGPWSCPWSQTMESNQTNAVSVSINLRCRQHRHAEKTQQTPQDRSGQFWSAEVWPTGLLSRTQSGLNFLDQPASV